MLAGELRERRRALRLSQAELGRTLGVARNTLARWERGELAIRHPELVALALDRLGGRVPGMVAAPPRVDGPAHNLPAELNSFVGREEELAELTGLLETTRLLTLTGVGGVGKTRLALKVAREVLPQRDGGVWFIDLAPVGDHSLLPATAATALGVREQPGQPVLATLAIAIGPQRLLLVLDNCEHLVQACAELVDALLRSCPGLTILATSREALHVPGETTWPVPPLTVADPSSATTVAALGASEAFQLFVERARAIMPSFAVTPDNSRMVAQVCARLDGVPLALELAAACINVMSPHQIATRLDDRLRLLVRGSRTAQPRQQTLRMTLDWSYALLGASQRKLFSRLTVFAGDWDLEAAETVCAGEDLESSQVLDLLTHLVDKSLVVVSGGGTRRYRLLETIRAYGRQYLEASGEADRLLERHAVFYLRLAKVLGSEVSPTGPGAAAALEQLTREGDNLRAALRWAVDAGEADIGLRLSGALAEVWYRVGSLSEGSYWLAEVLALPQASAPGFERAWALNGAGWLALCQGKHVTARALNDESLAIGRTLNDPLLVSRALVNLGVDAQQRGEYGTARQLQEEALAVTRGSGDRIGEAMSLMNLTSVAADVGDYAAVDKLGGEVLALGQVLSSAWVTADALRWLGWANVGRGRLIRARSLLEESLIAARESGDRNFIAGSLNALGSVFLKQGEVVRGGALVRESLQIRREMGDWPNIPSSLESLAEACTTAGQSEQAVYQLAAAAGLRETLDTPRSPRERLAVQCSLDAARHALRNEGFDAAWAAGRAMPLEQVLDLAILAETSGPSSTTSASTTSTRSTDRLTSREREVVALVARGLTNHQIARELVISDRTVENHLRHIFDKLGASSRALVAAWAVAHGVLALSSA